MPVLDTNILINAYFEDIAQIPHGSYNEEGIADYIESVAQEQQLRYVRDEMNNIVIYKEATEGYENHAPVMLQGHMDMVNEKNNDSNHDFENDPLDLYVEDGCLCAKGTTLGADDGYGICYMLAILTDDTLVHPSLECVFTVQEEVGLYGAAGLDASILHSKRMIGLDSETEGETCTSSSGGCDLSMIKSIHYQNNEKPVYQIEVKGLLGGHSGECINKGRGNANKICARLLYQLLKNGIDVQLVDITGGLKNNAIPRECVATFASYNSYDEIKVIVYSLYEDIRKELEIGDPDIQVNVKQDESDICIFADESESIISMMFLAINGCIEQSQVIPGLTTVSLNMGIVRMNENEIIIDYSIRSPLKSARQNLCQQLELVTQIYNGFVQISGDYLGWDYDPHSQLRCQFKDFYLQKTGQQLKEVATHGGLETGIFKGKIPELDIITMGPNMSDIHTPDEKLDIQSYLNTYQLLVEFIATL